MYDYQPIKLLFSGQYDISTMAMLCVPEQYGVIEFHPASIYQYIILANGMNGKLLKIIKYVCIDQINAIFIHKRI